MPVKARRPKRRVTEAAELSAWQDVFQTGYDFFDDVGFSHRESDPAFQVAAREAWKRLGARYLEIRSESEADCSPWALQEFGTLPCR